MIYLKENDNTITSNLFVLKNLECLKETDIYYSKLKSVSPYLKHNIVTAEDFTISSGHSRVSPFSLATEGIISQEIYNEFELLLNCNLPDECKLKYIQKLNAFHTFEYFVTNILRDLELKKLQTFNIEELKKLRDLSANLGVYSDARVIVSDSSLEIAQSNVKVLSIIDSYNKNFNKRG